MISTWYGVMMYVNFVFVSVFIGYAIGCAPIVGFHYGAKNRHELKSLLRKSICLLSLSGLLLTLLGVCLSYPLTVIFVGFDAELLEMTRHGFVLYSVSFFFAAHAIFSSSFFTAFVILIKNFVHNFA